MAISLSGPVLAQQPQLLERAADVGGPGLLRQYAHRAERARLAQVQLAFLRGVHHHRDRGGARIVLDRGQRLEAVHARHQVIQEDDVRALADQVLDGLLGGCRAVDLQVIALEDAGQERTRGT